MNNFNLKKVQDLDSSKIEEESPYDDILNNYIQSRYPIQIEKNFENEINLINKNQKNISDLKNLLIKTCGKKNLHIVSLK